MPRHACLLTRLLPFVLLLACAPSHAADPPQWWLDVNLASQHFGDEDEFLAEGESFNEFNPGLGVEVQWQPRHAVAAGYFRNSVDDDSLYALYQYTPLQLGRYVRVGGMVGAVTGSPGHNDGGPAPAAGLVAKIEGARLGANVIVLPRIADRIPATLGLQFKVRLR